MQIKLEQEQPDLIIGIFHLSLFRSFNSNAPTIEQFITTSSINWDLIIASQTIKAYPTDNKTPLTKIKGTPIVSAAGRGRGWLELDFLPDLLGNYKIVVHQHSAKSIKKNSPKNIKFLNYLNQDTGWELVQKNKSKIRICLEHTIAQAVLDDTTYYSLLPKLRLESLFLRKGETIQRKHLFYWLPYFNRKTVMNFSAYDLQKMQQSYWKKNYFFYKIKNLPKETGFFAKYKKKYSAVITDFDSQPDSFLTNYFLQSEKNILAKVDYLHRLWFAYLSQNKPDARFCKIFSKQS